MKRFLAAAGFLAGIFLATTAWADDYIRGKSAHNFQDTAKRLEQAIEVRNIRLIAKVNHAGAARESGLSLRPTTVYIFGNPQLGTPLMKENQESAIDLPMKILIWQNALGEVWLSYRDPASMASQWGIDPGHASISRMTRGLKAILADALLD